MGKIETLKMSAKVIASSEVLQNNNLECECYDHNVNTGKVQHCIPNCFGHVHAEARNNVVFKS